MDDHPLDSFGKVMVNLPSLWAAEFGFVKLGEAAQRAFGFRIPRISARPPFRQQC